MHASTLLMASVAVLSTFAIAEPQRPKFYFPRQIKRQVVFNSSSTTAPQQSSQERFSSSSSSSSSFSSTKRDGLGDLLGKATGKQDSTADSGETSSGSAAGTGGLLDGIFTPIKPTSSKPPKSDDPKGPTETPHSEATPNAGFLGFLTTASEPSVPTGSLPDVVVQPTPGSTSDSSKPGSTSSSASSPEGITFGPGGVLTDGTTSTSAPPSPPAAESESKSDGVSFSGPAASTGADVTTTSNAAPQLTNAKPPPDGILPSIGDVISSVFIPASTADSTSQMGSVDTTTTSDAAPTNPPPINISSLLGLPSSVPEPSGGPTTTSLAEPTTTRPPLIDVTSVLGTGIPSASPTSTLEGTGSSITPIIVTSFAEPTATATPTTDLGGILSSILNPPSSSVAVEASSTEIVTSAPQATPTLTTDPALNTTFPGPVSVVTPIDQTPIISPTSSGLIVTAEPTTTGPITSGPVTTSAPVTNPTDAPIITTNSTSNPITDLPITTSSPVNGTEIPTGTATATEITTGTATLPTSTAFATNATEPTIPQTSSASPVASVDTSLTTLAPTTTFEPQTIVPTATNSDTSMWLPTTIIAASPPSSASGQSQSSQPTGIASSLPRVITNPNVTSQPEDTTQIQIPFTFPLNFQFVVDNPKSSAQIFMYLPQGIADGLGLKKSQVAMHSLVPLDTTQTLQYITTLALAYIPSNMVSTLSLDLHIPTSALYNNDDPSINELMSYINPAIPIIPGSNMETGSGPVGTPGGSEPSSNPPAGNGNSVFGGDTNGQNQTPGKTGATAGIAMAAIGGTVAYGAAMFLIARRYKKKKQSHRRSSSITHGEMRQSGSPALMGGAGVYMSGGRTTPAMYDRNSRGSGRTGNSARTQQISAPMMAENSLGWN